MARNINFVRERQRKITQAELRDTIVLKWLFRIFIGVLVAVVVTVGIRFFVMYKVNQNITEQKNLRTTIGTKESIEKSFTIFSYKLKTLTELFGKRKEKQEALAYFSSLFGPDVIIRQLSYSDDGEVLTFTLESKNVFVLDEVFTKMNTFEVKSKYPTIVKESLRRGPNGKYGMSVMITLGDSNPAAAVTSEETTP